MSGIDANLGVRFLGLGPTRGVTERTAKFTTHIVSKSI